MTLKRFVPAVLAIALAVPARAQQPSELRAVWLTNVDSNVLFTDQNIADAMDYLASIGVNVVFPVVYNKGYTLYPSPIMTNLFGAPVLPNSPFVGRDFLDRLVIEAHRNGIEVIPWFEFGFSTSYSLNGGHIIAEYPSWALDDVNGNLVVDNGFDWMSAINPDAQNFILSLMTEVLDRYNVDGVQGDDRLPAMPVQGGYDSVTVQIYKAEHAGQAPPTDMYDTAWMRWRADKLTQFLSRLRDSVAARDTNLILSVSPAPYYWGYRELLQDSKTWAQQKLVDNIIPQLYQYNLSDYTYALNTTWTDVGQYDPLAFTAGILARVGTYVVDTMFLGQMISASRTKGANGECFFFYEGLRANGDAIGSYLKRNFYQSPALLPYRNGIRWIAPAQIVNETDAAAEVSGVWTSYAMKGYQGMIDRTSDTVNAASIRYDFTISASGFYDVYAYMTPNTIWTRHAVYTLRGDGDSSVVVVDQTDLTRKGWEKIGTVHLSPGTFAVLTVDNSQLASGEYLVADAAMLMLNRRLSPTAVITRVPGGASGSAVPTGMQLFDNYPNPFNPSTTIRFRISATEARPGMAEQETSSVHVTLTVFDMLGREVATLVDEPMRPGEYRISWDGKNAHGAPVSSGTYVYELKAGNAVSAKKMLLVR